MFELCRRESLLCFPEKEREEAELEATEEVEGELSEEEEGKMNFSFCFILESLV